MKTAALIDLIPDDDTKILINIESGPYRTPGKISDLVGSDPIDTIIESDYPRTDVTGREFRSMLRAQDPEGDAQLFVSVREGASDYYDISKVTTRKVGYAILIAGAWRTGGRD